MWLLPERGGPFLVFERHCAIQVQFPHNMAEIKLSARVCELYLVITGGEDINMADRAGSGAAEADAAEATGQPEATLPAPDQDPQFEQGRLVRIDFGEAEHELGFGDIRSAFDGIAYVEFQKVSTAPEEPPLCSACDIVASRSLTWVV